MTVIAGGEGDFSVGEVLQLTGVSDTTLCRYAKRAGVQTPRQGKKNHRYSGPEVKAILIQMASNIRCQATRQRCCGLLAKCADCPFADKPTEGFATSV